MNDEHDDPDSDSDFAGAIDEKQAMADIARGAKALRDVQKTARKELDGVLEFPPSGAGAACAKWRSSAREPATFRPKPTATK